MIIIIVMFFSIIWGVILATEITPWNTLKDMIGLGTDRKTFSDLPLVDFFLFMIWKLLNCPKCLSYHIFWISFLVLTGSWIGLIYGGVVYFLTGWFLKIV